MCTYSVIRCEEELTITDGTVTFSNLNFNGSEASFTCNEGYKLMGELMATCQENGEWSTNAPHCIGTYVRTYVNMSVEYSVYWSLL